MIKTIYLNLEDDIAKITAKLKREKHPEVVLVFPKKSFIFSDSINLRLLKKQVDLLGKKVSILTMDEMGQAFAKEAGFDLKFLPKSVANRGFDIRRGVAKPQLSVKPEKPSAPRQAVKKTLKRATPMAAATPLRIHHASQMPLDKPRHQRAPNKFRKALIGFVVICLIVIIALVFVILPRADITVYAKTQTLSRDIDMSLDTHTTQADASQLKLPATAIDQTQDESQTFQTNGKNEVGSKAQGRVAIYNLTGKPLNLKSTTTVLSVASKNYTFNADQNGIHSLPSATQDQSATVADITAQAGGESFNLPAGTRLEITNQAFGSQPQRLWAKTVTQVVGGASRFISVISHDDVSKAQATLNAAAVDAIRQTIKDRNLVLLDDAQATTPSAFSTDKPEGTETPSFIAKTTVSVKGLAFNQNDLVKLIRDRLTLSLSGNKQLQDISADTMSIKVKNLDAAAGVLSLSIHYESKALPQLDVAGVRQQIAGKSKQEASEILLSNVDIDRVDITLSPAWQGSIPRFSGKINLYVKK